MNTLRTAPAKNLILGVCVHTVFVARSHAVHTVLVPHGMPGLNAFASDL